MRLSKQNELGKILRERVEKPELTVKRVDLEKGVAQTDKWGRCNVTTEDRDLRQEVDSMQKMIIYNDKIYFLNKYIYVVINQIKLKKFK